MSGVLVSITFLNTVYCDGKELRYYSPTEHVLVKYKLLKEGVELTDRIHTVFVPMSNIRHIIHKKE